MEKEDVEESSTSRSPQMSSSSFQSAQLLSNDEIKKLGIPEHAIEMYRRTRYQANFGIDTWYDKLEQYTFKTTQFDLTWDEANALARPERFRTQEDSDVMSGLSDKIEKILAQWREKGISSAFVKLSTRSPKDVTVYDFDNKTLQQLVMDEIKKESDHPTDNQIVWGFIRATSRGLKVSSGKEALDLLSRSTRIKEDLGKILQFGQEHFFASIVLREWLDEVADRPQMEFRAFVNEGKLNAMSQYFCLVVHPDLIDQKEKLERDILKFFDSVKDKISHTAYVVDFYIKSDGTPLIIELNPFHIGAGPCLFSWKTDRDRFLNGPFEFRILDKDPEDPLEIIPIRWARWIRAQLNPDQDAQSQNQGSSWWWCSTM